ELRFVVGVIRQRSEARPACAHVHVKTEPIAAGPKIHSAVCDTPIEQRVGVAPHVEQTADIEPTCLDVPRAAHWIRTRADRQAGLWLHQRELEVPVANARHVPGSCRRADPDPCWARESGGANCESHAAGPRDCDHVGMQSHSMAEIEIESLQSQQRPNADVYC